MTFETLKANRTDIIAFIENNDANVKEVMAACLKYIGFNGIESTEVIAYVAEVMKLEKMITPQVFSNAASIWLAEKNLESAMNNLPSSLR